MAHVEKYIAAAVGHMCDHYGRTEGQDVKRSNSDIDPKRTGLNYNLAAADQPMNQIDFIHRRLSEVRVQNRKDVNILCDWVVTAPKDLPEHEQGLFFQKTYEFLRDRYGDQNTVSAYVHMDETTPHLHYAFIPVTPDQRRGGFKVSAKQVLTREDLRTFHPDLQRHLQQVLKHEIGILNGATDGGNRTITELKQETAEKALQQKEKQVEDLDLRAKILRQDIMTADQTKDVPHAKTLIGGKITLDQSTFDALCKTAARAEGMQKEIEAARAINVQKDKILGDAERQAMDLMRDATYKANSIENQVIYGKLKTQLDQVREVFDFDPNLQQLYERSRRRMERERRQQQRQKRTYRQDLDHGPEL